MTICEIIGSDGCILPPMVIVSGTVHQEWWYTTIGIGDTMLAVSDSGYSNDVLSLEWLKHFGCFSAQW